MADLLVPCRSLVSQPLPVQHTARRSFADLARLSSLSLPLRAFARSLRHLPTLPSTPWTLQNSGHEQYCSLYLSCEPTSLEKELGLASLAAASTSTSTSTSASAAYIGPGGEGGGAGEHRHGHGHGGRAQKEGRGPWKREGKFKFTFEVSSPVRWCSRRWPDLIALPFPSLGPIAGPLADPVQADGSD